MDTELEIQRLLSRVQELERENVILEQRSEFGTQK